MDKKENFLQYIKQICLCYWFFFLNKVFKNCQPTIMRPRAWTMQKSYLKRSVFYLQRSPYKHLVETGRRNSYLSSAVLISPALSFLNPLLSALLPLCFTPASHCCASQQMSTGWGSSSLALHTLIVSVSSLLCFNNVFCLFQIIPWEFALMLKTEGRFKCIKGCIF